MKKVIAILRWLTPITIEAIGIVFFIAGDVFYFCVKRSMQPHENISKIFIEKAILYWNISAVIMMIGGVFILLGLFGMFIKIIETQLNETADIKLKRSSSKRSLVLIIAFVIPVVFHFLYEPINRNIIVKEFGCGCPKLNDRLISFDANTFSMILWGIIMFIVSVLWSKGIPQLKNRLARFWISIIGLSILYSLCMWLMFRSFWM